MGVVWALVFVLEEDGNVTIRGAVDAVVKLSVVKVVTVSVSIVCLFYSIVAAAAAAIKMCCFQHLSK